MANPFDVEVVNPLQALLLGQQSYNSGIENAKKQAQEQARTEAGQLYGQGNTQGAIAKLLGANDFGGAGNIATIQKALSPSEGPASIQEYKIAQGQGFKGTLLDYLTKKAEAGASKTNVNVGGGTDKQIFDSVEESYKSAKAAATGLKGITEASKALNSPGGTITGFGANQNLALQKIGSALGVTDPSAIQNTETFRAAIAPQVAAMLKSTVGTTNISNSDREFAEKAAGGNITLDEGSIRRLLSVMKRAGEGIVKEHNDRLNAIYPDKQKFRREHALFGVNAGGAVKIPQGMSPDQAMKAFPPGTPIILPDGTEGVVPGG